MASAVSIKVDEELLRDIHIRAAQKGVSTQRDVTELIERDIFPERFPQLTDEQTRELRMALKQADDALQRVMGIVSTQQEQSLDDVPPMQMSGPL